MNKALLKKMIMISIGILLLCSSANAQEELLFSENFEGGTDPAWQLEPGWEVKEADGNTYLEGEGHTWARLEIFFPTTYRLRFRLNIIRGRVHLNTNMDVRGRYFSGLEHNRTDFHLQYWPDEFHENLAHSRQNILSSGWHEVEFSAAEGFLTLKVDGQVQWEYQDSDPLGQGSIAFESLEDSLVQVDDIEVFGSGEPLDSREDDPDADSTSTWIRTGGPLGGLGYDVRMHPENPDKMYVTDAFAGVFISENGGDLWFPSNQGINDRSGESQDAIPIFCLTVDPNDPEIVWAGTEFSGGLYKSTDGGQNWTKKTTGISLQDGLTFRGISVKPGDSQVVYAAGEISSWAWSEVAVVGREFDLTKGIVYKSKDGGESWQEVWRGDNLARYILINPQNPEVMYLSTGIFDREAANSDPGGGLPGGEGVLKSLDGGETWTHINNGLDNLYVGSLAMHPENPEILLAGTGHNQYWRNSGVYRTSNGGSTWEFVSRGYEVNINSVEFAESDADIAYAGGDAMILRSKDGGYSWEKVTAGEDGWGAPGVRGGFPIDFQVDPRNPDRIFANNYGGGNFLSEDGGQTWVVASTGYTGAQVRSIAVDPQEPGRVYVAARSGLFVSHDGGSTWQGIAYPPYRVLEWNAIAVDPAQPKHVLTGSNWFGGLLSTTDGGQSWEMASTQPGEGFGIRSLTFDPADPSNIYAGTGAFYSAGGFSDNMSALGILQSRDGGKTWVLSTQSRYGDAHVTDISVSPENGDLVFAATTNYGLLRSQDGGESWEAINQGLISGLGVHAVAVNPYNPEVILGGLHLGGIFRSENGGDSWQQASAGLNPESNITDIIFHPASPDIVFATDTFSGVYRSTDGGNTWRPFNTGLRMRAVNQMAFSTDGNHLYAATEGEGVFRFDFNGQPPPAADDIEFTRQDFKESGEDEIEDEQAMATEQDELSQEQETAIEPDSAPAPLQQTCPGSYLPIAALFFGYGTWRKKKINK